MKNKFAAVWLIALFLPVALALASLCAQAGGKILIVTSTTDLADLARNIGGTKVEVYSFARGYEDPHFIEPKPSHILKLKEAGLYLVNGLYLEYGYSPVLEQAAGVPELMRGGRNYIDCSAGVPVIEIPKQYDRALGDIHPQGNPHYLTDPHNAVAVVNNIAGALEGRYPEYAEYFESNRRSYQTTLAEKLKEWDRQMARLKGTKVVVYHNLWSYLIRRNGMELIGTIEPVPGIAPSPAHVSRILNLMKATGCSYVISTTYLEKKVPQSIASEVGGKLIVLPAMVGAVKGCATYIQWMDYIVNTLSEEIK